MVRGASTHMPPVPFADKELQKLHKRAWDLCKTFCVPNWRSTTRGKECTIKNIRIAAEKYKNGCLASRRENRIPSLDRIVTLMYGCRDLIIQARVKNEGFEPVEFVGKVALLRNFLDDMVGDSQDGGGNELDPELLNTQVGRGVQGHMGSIHRATLAPGP